jgi:hypothetical protein
MWPVDEYTDAAAALDDLVDALDSPHDLGGETDVESLPLDEATLAVADNYHEPWSRLPDETDRGWDVFKYHRDQGPARVLKESAAHFGVGPAALWKFSATYDWVERLRAFDQHEDRLYNARRATAIKEMAERHGDQIQGYLEALAIPFKALQAKLENDPKAIDDLSESSMKQLIDMSAKAGRIIPTMMNAERLARGMPSEVVRVEGDVTHTHELDRDQLDEVLSTLQQAGAWHGLLDGSPDGGGEPFLEAEVVEVHSEDRTDVRAEPEAARFPAAD